MQIEEKLVYPLVDEYVGHEPEQEADEVGPAALGERGDVLACLFAQAPIPAASPCSARSGRASSSTTMARAEVLPATSRVEMTAIRCW